MTTLDTLSSLEKINYFSTSIVLKKKNKCFQQFPESILASTNLPSKQNDSSYAQNINELNKTKVYLIVSNFKKNENKLLLIQTQEQVSALKPLKNKRFDKVFLNGRQKGYHPGQWFNEKTFEVFRGINLSPIFRTNLGSGLSEYFRNGNFYFPENLGGHKSICPVFFDAEAAEMFLYNMQEEAFAFLAGFPHAVFFQKMEKKALLKKITNTRIICVGLGDFLEFYCDESLLEDNISEDNISEDNISEKNQHKEEKISFQKKTLQQIEFLFIPTYEDLENKCSKLNLPFLKKGVIFNSFNSYQEKFLQQKKSSTI